MPKIIPVPGIGNVAFPDGMADEEINRVLIGASAKSRLAAQGLTPEAVKAGQGVTSPGSFTDQENLSGGEVGGAGLRGVGIPTSAEGWKQLGLNAIPGYGIARQGGQADALINDIREGYVPFVGRPTHAVVQPLRAVAENRPPTRQENIDQIQGATTLGALAAAPKVLPKVLPKLADAAESAATDLKAVAARQAIRGRNAQIGATPKDIALGGDPGRGAAAIGTKSIGGFGRAEEINSGLDTAKAAKQDFMANDSRAQQRVFDPKPLIEQAIESKVSLMPSSPAFRSALNSFANRMRASISGITKGEPRPLSAAEMDTLRKQVDANWAKVSKQFELVTKTETKINDAAVDMNRALRHSLESPQSPIASEYKALNQRIQDLTQAKTVQARTNDESMAPPQTPTQQKTSDLHTTGVGLARAALRPNPAGASPMNLLRNTYYNMLAKVGGLKTDLPVPQPYAPPIEGLSSPGYPTEIVPANYRSQPPQFAAGPSGPAYDVSPTSPSHFIDRAQALQQFAQAERQAPSEVSIPAGGHYQTMAAGSSGPAYDVGPASSGAFVDRAQGLQQFAQAELQPSSPVFNPSPIGQYQTMAAGPEGPAFDPSMVRPVAVNQGGFQVAPQTPLWMGGQQLGTLPNGLPPRIPDWLLQQYMREIGMRNIDTNPIR